MTTSQSAQATPQASNEASNNAPTQPRTYLLISPKQFRNSLLGDAIFIAIAVFTLLRSGHMLLMGVGLAILAGSVAAFVWMIRLREKTATALFWFNAWPIMAFWLAFALPDALLSRDFALLIFCAVVLAVVLVFYKQINKKIDEAVAKHNLTIAVADLPPGTPNNTHHIITTSKSNP